MADGVTLTNLKTQSDEAPPDGAPVAALAAGTHVPAGGYKALVDPDGNLVMSPPDLIQENLERNNFSVPTQDQLNWFARKEKYGDGALNKVKTAVFGGLRGASVNLSDVILPHTGITTPEELSGLQEFNPGLSTASEIGGAIAGSAAFPEEAPAAMAARLGEGATTLAGRVLGSGGLGKVASKALGSGIEGAVWGLGQSVSEAELGDPSEAAEHLAANVGYGALWGGGLGGLLKGAEVATPKVLNNAAGVIGKAYEGLFGSVKDVEGPVEAAMKPEVAYEPGFMTSGIIKANSLATKTPADEILAGINEKLNKPTLSREEFNEFSRSAVSNLGDLVKAGDQVADELGVLGQGEGRAATLYKDMRDDVMYHYGVRNEISPTKMETYFNSINSPKADPKTAALKNFLDLLPKMVEEADSAYKSFTPEASFDKAARLSGMTEKERDLLMASRIVQRTSEAHGAGQGGMRDLLTGAAMSLFNPLAGIAGVAGKEVFNAMRNPEGAIEKLIKFERTAQKVTNTIRSGAAAAIDAGSQATKGVSGAGMIGERAAAVAQQQQEFQAKLDDLQERQQNPEKTVESVLAAVGPGTRAAPETMKQLQLLMMKGHALLTSKVPQSPLAQTPLDPPFQPCTGEIAKFNRYHDTLNDPLSALSQLKTGSVSPESKEVLSTIYPKLYDKMKTELVSQLSAKITSKTPVPFQRRLAIADFIGHPLESAAMPQNIAANQAILNAQRSDQQATKTAQVNRASTKAMEKMGVASRMKTSMQATTERS